VHGGAEDRAVPIVGVALARLEIHTDDRGALFEAFRASALRGRPTVQANVTSSRPGVLRGLHFHRYQSDYWVPLDGRALVGLYDLRAGSPTRGRGATISLDAGDPHALYIPAGVAHGFAARTHCRMLYLVDAEFTGDDEFGVAWDDPAIDIEWGIDDPLLSERDRSNPSLEEVLADPPVFHE
jgi:dTDP-4-dehydrorhamnose 3,5-epimerase